MTRVSYGRNLSDRARQHPDRTVIVHVDVDGRERPLTWRELDERSNQVARLFASRGVDQGALVAVALPNILEHFYASYGAWKLGATVMPMRWSLPAWEQQRLVDLADPALIVSDGSLEGERVVDLATVRGSTALGAGPLPDRTAQPARAIATSGSTGRPKLIVTPTPAVFDTEAPPNPMAIANPDVIQLLTSPLYHTNGFGTHLRIMAGATVIVMERFDAARVIDLIERWKVNHIVLVPTMLQRIARLDGLDERDLSTLTDVYYGGAPLAPWVARRWLELVGPDHFFFQYGGTEEIGGCMADGHEWLAHAGTVGRPKGTLMRIVDEHGDEVPTGQVGEIFMRPVGGPPPFRYVGAPMPRATEDGYTTLGDLGWTDEDGYLYIADRRVDMVITGGANVYPAEVEAALSEHPDVADAVVIGLSDAEWGRRLHAVVEPRDVSAPPSADALRAHCKERLAPYKVPKDFELVDRLPRSEAGKLNRSALVAEREPVQP